MERTTMGKRIEREDSNTITKTMTRRDLEKVSTTEIEETTTETALETTEGRMTTLTTMMATKSTLQRIRTTSNPGERTMISTPNKTGEERDRDTRTTTTLERMEALSTFKNQPLRQSTEMIRMLQVLMLEMVRECKTTLNNLIISRRVIVITPIMETNKPLPQSQPKSQSTRKKMMIRTKKSTAP